MTQAKIPLLRSPRQASQAFVQKGFPKQRHAFLVQFIRAGATSVNTSLTFAVKSVDRPSVQPHVEELNQYNKKRLVHTGYKTNGLKITFYDTADSSAQRMWSDYSKYYFGDFAQTTSSYGYDATRPEMYDLSSFSKSQPKAGFGFTAANGGSGDAEGQFFFKEIRILHFYSKTYDLYSLVNPRFTSFDPDELDYGNGEVSTISAQLAFESMQFYVNAPSAGFPAAAGLSEFQPGAAFNGGTFEPPSKHTLIGPVSVPNPFGTSSSDPVEDVLNLLRPMPVQQIADYRYFDAPTAGSGLGVFGSFAFGANSARSQSGFGGSLGLLATGNGALSAALNLHLGPVSLSLATPTAAGFAAAGINGDRYSSMASGVAANYSGYGPAGSAVTQGLLSTLLADIPPSDGPCTLSDSTLGAINATGSGAAQYGVNTSVLPPVPEFSVDGYNHPVDTSVVLPPLPEYTVNGTDAPVGAATNGGGAK